MSWIMKAKINRCLKNNHRTLGGYIIEYAK